jgi:hypothetical protein
VSAKGQGVVLVAVGGAVLVALVAAVQIAAKRAAAPATVAPAKPAKPKPPPSPTPAPGVATGQENKAAALTAAETLSLANDSADLLYAWGMVTPHKIYAQGIANKLASSGDTRAQYVNARVANWTGAVTYAGLMSPDADMVADPSKFTLDQIADGAGASDATNFKLWAAQFLRANQRNEQAQLILDQVEASKVS